jgi:poly(beta-D-mannuronate) lyase
MTMESKMKHKKMKHKKQIAVTLLMTAGLSLAIWSFGRSPVAAQSADYLFIEAENGAPSSPLQILSDTNASNDLYIQVAAGNNSQAAPPASGIATFNFSASGAGTYKVWGRVIAPTNGDDSFWVRMDSGAWVNWNNIPVGGAWHWDDVHNGAAGNVLVTYNLAAGSHTLQFAYREDGTRLDRLLVTNDLQFVPTGLGEPPGTGDCLRTISVDTNAELTAAVANARAGDCIVLADGNYASFTISADGTAASPILIRAANRGRANITSGIIRFNQTSFVTVEGLNITTAGATVSIDGGDRKVAVLFQAADHSRLTRCTLRLSGHTGGTHWVMLGGNSRDNRIDHCEFGPNNVGGCHLIWPRGNPSIPGVTPDPLRDRGPWSEGRGPFNPNVARNTRIDHNYFHDHLPTVTNGGETIVLGGMGMTGDYQNINTIVEFNLWENCFGDGELISIKSSTNTIRYNTVRRSGGGFTARAGNNAQIYGNFILQDGRASSGAIRIHEKDHLVYNNYIEETTGNPIIVGYGDPYNQSGFSHAQVVRARLVHNTLVNCGGVFRIGTAHPLPPVDLVVANNLFLNTGFGAPAPMSGWIYSQNISWPSGPGQTGFIVVNPLLTTVNGLLKLSGGSPAINAANNGVNPFVTDDMDGHARAGARDIGADEFSSAPISRRPLSTSDVGPNAP